MKEEIKPGPPVAVQKAESLDDKLSVVAVEYFHAFLRLNEKHNSLFLSARESRAFSSASLIKKSNRVCESLIGLAKFILERNCWTNSLFIWAMLTIIWFTRWPMWEGKGEAALKRIIIEVCEKFDVYSLAVSLIAAHRGQQKKINSSLFDEFVSNWVTGNMEKLRKQRKKELDDIMLRYLQFNNFSFPLSEAQKKKSKSTRITRLVLREFLKQRGVSPGNNLDQLHAQTVKEMKRDVTRLLSAAPSSASLYKVSCIAIKNFWPIKFFCPRLIFLVQEVMRSMVRW